MVHKWEQGLEPDDDGKVAGKPIAADLVPFILRWVESEKVPSLEELAIGGDAAKKLTETSLCRDINLPLMKSTLRLTSR
jgi:hypothetical protein